MAPRVAADPLQFGELRGKGGSLRGAKTHAKREAARCAAGAIGPSVKRIGEAEGQAERIYRTGVETQHAADANGIPRLSAVAEAAIGTIAAAKDEKARPEAWRAAQADKRVAAGLRACGATVAQRFGEEGVRDTLRAGGRPGVVTLASVAPRASDRRWTVWPS